MKKQGFTIIELLVVISIIIVLIAIIMPSIGAYRRKAEDAKTESLLNMLSMGLDSYRSDNRQYPNIPDSTDFYSILNRELYSALTGDINENFSLDPSDKHGYISVTLGNLDYIDNSSAPYFVDPFGNRIGYWPYPTYHNRTKFNLWSRGSDGVTLSNARMGDGEDDINNWR